MMRGQYLSKNAQQLNKGLVIWHTFDSARATGATAYDDSGIGGDATLTAGYSFVTGKVGDALASTSTSGMASKNSVSGGQSKNASQVSVCAWVNLATISASRDRIYSEIGPGGSRLVLSVKTGGVIEIGFRISDADSFTTVVTGSSAFSTGDFRHVGAILNISGDNADIYYNGAVQSTTGTKTYTPTSFQNTDSTSIVFGISDGAVQFNGYLDGLRKYNRILSGAEMSAIYNMV